MNHPCSYKHIQSHIKDKNTESITEANYPKCLHLHKTLFVTVLRKIVVVDHFKRKLNILKSGFVWYSK